MTMGQRIRAARLEARLSQRELAGEEMTRNMLSALEHDGAKPSVHTLLYLSERLCKPVGYFFGETVVQAAGTEKMEQARRAVEVDEYARCLELLEDLDPMFQSEGALLRALALMGLAEEALKEERLPYARTLLERAREATAGGVYFRYMERQWILLMAKAGDKSALEGLKREDEMLLMRAEAALEKGRLDRAEGLLEAVEDRSPEWNWLRGESFLARRQYEQAALHYHNAEISLPDRTANRLEICYREMENYKMAYYYATKNKVETDRK